MQNLYQRIENLRGKKLLVLLLVLFIVFLFIGIIVGYFTDVKLNSNENPEKITTAAPTKPDEVLMDGVVRYVNPEQYPGEGIKYKLTDADGELVVLLRSGDDKLAIVEGLKVKVSGTKGTTKDGKFATLSVKEVIITNVAN